MIEVYNYTDEKSCHKNSKPDFNLSVTEKIAGRSQAIKKAGTVICLKDGANRVIFGIAGEQEINSDQWKNEGGEDWKAVMKITKWITDVIVLPEDYKISMQFTRMFRKSENQEILEQLLSDIITNNLI